MDSIYKLSCTWLGASPGALTEDISLAFHDTIDHILAEIVGWEMRVKNHQILLSRGSPRVGPATLVRSDQPTCLFTNEQYTHAKTPTISKIERDKDRI